MAKRKKRNIYFASDFHLGAPNHSQSRQRERVIVRWLETIQPNASALYLLGDIFDFWFEYQRVVPKGFTRLLGKLAELSDQGVDIHFFTGNHDLWAYGYLEEEIGMRVYRHPEIKKIGGKTFYLAHGDGLGPHDKGFKVLQKIFHNRFCQSLFAAIHPNWGVQLAHFWSRKSRASGDDVEFQGEENEWLIQFAKEKLKRQHVDYFVFGHRHLPLDIELSEQSRYLNLGDWLEHNSYAVFDGQDLQLQYFNDA